MERYKTYRRIFTTFLKIDRVATYGGRNTPIFFIKKCKFVVDILNKVCYNTNDFKEITHFKVLYTN